MTAMQSANAQSGISAESIATAGRRRRFMSSNIPHGGNNMRASKGLLFSLMVFLLLGSLMALRSASEHNQGALGAGLSESYAFRRVSDKYANVSKNLTDLTGNEAEKSVDQRILPFTY